MIGSIADIAKAFREVMASFEDVAKAPRQARDAVRELELDSVIGQINERLYGRYNLKQALERFARKEPMRDSDQDFREIIKTARERAVYLRNFNTMIEARLSRAEPKIASDMVWMTRGTIGLYEGLATIDDSEELRKIAPDLAVWVGQIADYLEQVNVKLKTIKSGNSA
jgi:hypothetical protein